jgi:hypothetical protein
MSEVDDQIARAVSVMQRISEEYRGHGERKARRAAKRARSIGQRVAVIAAADAAILIAAAIFGLFVPLGILGAVGVMLLMVAVTLAIALAPGPAAPTERKLREVDLRALPAQTERWLDAQRPALPAPARTLVDRIGTRLEQLSPQLGQLDGQTETAYEIRRLVGEQLPAFVNDYSRVPATLRTTPRNGKTPDAELVDGLKLIEREIAEMTERLAQGDLDSLSTRGRYLELKYRDGSET